MSIEDSLDEHAKFVADSMDQYAEHTERTQAMRNETEHDNILTFSTTSPLIHKVVDDMVAERMADEAVKTMDNEHIEMLTAHLLSSARYVTEASIQEAVNNARRIVSISRGTAS